MDARFIPSFHRKDVRKEQKQNDERSHRGPLTWMLYPIQCPSWKRSINGSTPHLTADFGHVPFMNTGQYGDW